MQPSIPHIPLYVVLTDQTTGLPLYAEDVFVVTSNFDFACCVCSRLTNCTCIVRVTCCNTWMHINRQAVQSVKHLDTLILDLAAVPDTDQRSLRCHICVKVDGMWSRKELLSIRPFGDLPPKHLARCYPYVLHEWLNFDQLNPFRQTSREKDQATLQCAKMDWVSELYFAKALKNRLPSEIVLLSQETCLQSCTT